MKATDPIVSCRLTPKEYNWLRKRMKQANVMTVQQALRMAVRDWAFTQHVPEAMRKQLCKP